MDEQNNKQMEELKKELNEALDIISFEIGTMKADGIDPSDPQLKAHEMAVSAMTIVHGLWNKAGNGAVE